MVGAIVAAVGIAAAQIAIVLLVREPWRRALAESEARRRAIESARDAARAALADASADAQARISAAQRAASDAIDVLGRLDEWPARPGVAGLLGPVRTELFRAAVAVERGFDAAADALPGAAAAAGDTAAAAGPVSRAARGLLERAFRKGRLGLDAGRRDLDRASADGARDLPGGLNVNASSQDRST